MNKDKTSRKHLKVKLQLVRTLTASELKQVQGGEGPSDCRYSHLSAPAQYEQ